VKTSLPSAAGFGTLDGRVTGFPSGLRFPRGCGASTVSTEGVASEKTLLMSQSRNSSVAAIADLSIAFPSRCCARPIDNATRRWDCS
jgi:hypothetical protein